MQNVATAYESRFVVFKTLSDLITYEYPWRHIMGKIQTPANLATWAPVWEQLSDEEGIEQ